MSVTGGGGLARVENLHVCKHLLPLGWWHMQERKGELTYRLVGVAIPPVSRKGGRTGLPARVSGHNRDDSPHLSLPKPAVCRWQ